MPILYRFFNRLPMKNFSLSSVCLCLITGLLTGCERTDRGPETATVGLRPVYASYAEIRSIQTLDPQPMRTPGKIYVKDNLLLINEVGRGIHVVDNTDPARPVKLSFVSIPGNIDLAMKGSVLYADNLVDLVALDLSNPRAVRVVKRLENAFPYQAYPPDRNVRFECADPAKGVVVRWERAELKDARCRR